MASFLQTSFYPTTQGLSPYHIDSGSRKSLTMGFVDSCLACCGLKPEREGWVYDGGGIYVTGQQVSQPLWGHLSFLYPPCLFVLFCLGVVNWKRAVGLGASDSSLDVRMLLQWQRRTLPRHH